MAGGTGAFDARTGTRKWLLDATFPHVLAASDGSIYATGDLNSVVPEQIAAYRLTDGTLLWLTQSTAEPYRGLGTDGRFVYAANNGGVEAFSISDCAAHPNCSHAWVSLVSGRSSSPSVSNGVLYAVHIDTDSQDPSTNHGLLDAIDINTGQRLLRKVYGPDVEMDQPVVANGSLLFTTRQVGADGAAHDTIHKLAVPNSSP
ncbi:MAG: PQQ-like beta-propeller repeat protein [Actinomycetota bacterium]|nr:PQQ-like beta-propeller repeat protein [Actinomycetota bacterium]